MGDEVLGRVVYGSECSTSKSKAGSRNIGSLTRVASSPCPENGEKGSEKSGLTSSGSGKQKTGGSDVAREGVVEQLVCRGSGWME